jgi:hypothetical protein
MTTVYEKPGITFRRDGLRTARRSLDDAITSPSVDTLDWAANLLTELRKLDRVFDKHIRESESNEGSLPEVLALKPHLQSRVGMVMNDHALIQRHIDDVIEDAEHQLGTAAVRVDSLRLTVGSLVDEVRAHQAKGIDLVYEAFHRVDGFG